MTTLTQGGDIRSATELSQETRAEKIARVAVEGKAALADYMAKAAAVDQKTLRLRALRLAREAEDQAAHVTAPLDNKKKANRRR